MNIPKSIEQAFMTVMRNKGVGASVIFRCWHNLNADERWTANLLKEKEDRYFPCIDVRCGAPKTSDMPSELTANTQISIATNNDDDQDHALINAQEQAAQEALDELFAQSRLDTGAIWDSFKASIYADCPGVLIGGLEFGDPLPPTDEGGINMVGISVTVHYSRSDFN
jgi:hypothetical protein